MAFNKFTNKITFQALKLQKNPKNIENTIIHNKMVVVSLYM